MGATTDIKLVFGVSMKGDPAGDSTEVIKKDLQRIVDEINANPMKIKFAADEASFAAVKEKLSSLSSSIGQITPNINIPDLGAALKSIAEASKAVSSQNEKTKQTQDGVTESTKRATQAQKSKVDSDKEETRVTKEKQVTMISFLNTYRELIAAVNNNKNASQLNQFKEISKYADVFSRIYEMVSSGEYSLKDAFSLRETSSVAEINNAKQALADFKLQLEQTGQKGTVTFTQLYTVIRQATDVLNNAAPSTGTNTYENLENKVHLLGTALRTAQKGSIKLEEAFRSMGVNGSQLIDDVRKHMADLGMQVSEDARYVTIPINEAIKKTTELQSLLNRKDVKEIKGTEAYNEVKMLLDAINGQIKLAENGFVDLDRVTLSSGKHVYNAMQAAENAVIRLKSAAATAKGEIETVFPKSTSGKSSGINEMDLTKGIRSMQDVLNSGDKNGLSSTASWIDLSEKVLKLKTALELVQRNGLSVSEALKKAGAVGTNSFEQARLSAEKLKLTISNSKSALIPLVDTSSKLSAEEKEKQALLSKSYALLGQIKNAEKEWTAAAKGRSSVAYSQIKEYSMALSNLINNYSRGGISQEKFKKDLSTIQYAFKQNATTIKQCGENTRSFSDRLAGLTKHFGMWFSMSRIIMYAYRTLRQMITASVELDDAMTQLKIVTKDTEAVYDNFASTIARVAQRTASSISDIVSSTTVYARLGYSLEESMKIAEYTAKLQNVGDIEVADAQNAITSILKAYDDVDANHIEEVMNKLVTTGNGFPISVSQIAEGMTNASSALAAAGNTFDQSVALLTAANTTIQDAAKASTGLRTIAARIRKTDTELDSLGESMTSAKYDELIKSLTNLDIALVDVNGEYRSTYDIMADIASKWDTMTSMEQAALADVISGTRQQAVFFSLIGQFKEASGSMDAMASSAGALDEAYSTYLESTTAHINQFKASFQELSSNTFNSKFLAMLVDIGKGIVNFVNAFAKLNLLLPSIIVSAVALKGLRTGKEVRQAAINANILAQKLILEKEVTDKTTVSIAALNAKNRETVAIKIKAAMATKTLSKEEGKAILDAIALAGSEEVLAGENTKLALSFKAVAASIPVWGLVALGLSAVIGTITFFSSVNDDARSSFHESTEEYKSGVTELENYKKRIQEINDSTETQVEKLKQLSEVKDELFTKYKIEISNIEDETKATEELNNALEEQRKLERDLYISNQQTQYESNKRMLEQKNINGSSKSGVLGWVEVNAKIDTSQVSDDIKDLFESVSFIDRSTSLFGGAKNDSSNRFTIESDYKNKAEYFEKLKNVYTEFVKISNTRKGGLTKDEQTILNQVKIQYDALKEELTKDNADIVGSVKTVAAAIADQIIGSIPKGTKSFAEWRAELINVADGDQFVIEQIENMISETVTLEKISVNAFDSISDSISRLNGKFEMISDSIKTANDYFEDLEKVFKTNDDANKYFKSSEIVELLETYPQLKDAILETQYGYKIEKEALDSLRQAKLDEQKDAITAQIKETESLIKSTEVKLKAYEAEIGGVNDLISAKFKLAEIDTQINIINNSSLNNLLKTKMTEQLNKQKTQINGFIQATNELKGYKESLKTAAIQLEVLGRVHDDVKDSTTDTTKAINTEKEAIKSLNEDLKEAQNDINDLIKLTMDMIKQQKKDEKDNLKNTLDAYKKIIDRKKELIDLEKEQRNFEKEVNENNRDMLEAQQELEALSVEGAEYSLEDMKRRAELEKTFADLKEKRDDTLFEHEVETRKKALDDEEEAFSDKINAQIDMIEDYLKREGDIRQDAINLINGKTQAFYNDLYNYTVTYTDKSSYEFNKLWNDAYLALEKYGNGQLDVSSVLAYLAMQIDDCDNRIKDLDNSIDSAKSSVSSLAQTIVDEMAAADAAVTKVSSDLLNLGNGTWGLVSLANSAYQQLRGAIGTVSSSDGQLKNPLLSSYMSNWAKLNNYALSKGLPKYHSGGIVDGGGVAAHTEVLAKLMKGEIVITPTQAKDFMSKTLPKLTTANTINNQPTINIGDINISGNADSNTVAQLDAIRKDIINDVYKAVNDQKNVFNGRKIRTI